MKKMILLPIVFFAVLARGQSLAIGDQLPEFSFTEAIPPGEVTSTLKNLSLSRFADQVILLDFWATWCGSCLEAMPKLEKLQQQFKGKLQVVAVTTQPVSRIQSFLKNRPTRLLMAIDTAGRLQKYFPHRTIPHVVLIDSKGKVAAITNSAHITESVISDLLANKPLSLPYKNDNVEFDFSADYFKVDSNTSESFNLQPAIPGIGTFSKVGQGIFKDRRLSLHNFQIDGMYRMAYNQSYFRVKYEMDQKEFDYNNPRNLFCLDVIVPDASKAALLAYMRKKLPVYFDIKARMEKRKTPVYILKKSGAPLNLKKSETFQEYFGGSSGSFESAGATLDQLAEYLEAFGKTGTPVLNETGILGYYELKLNWETEKKGAIKEILASLGLVLEKAERELDMLIISR